MRSIWLAVISGALLLNCTALAAEAEIPVGCGDYDLAGLSEGKPLVRVEPTFGKELRTDSVDSCIIVIYGLRAKRGSDGRILVTHGSKAVAWSHDVPRGARNAAQRAVGKWLFLARTQAASDDAVYFHVFTF